MLRAEHRLRKGTDYQAVVRGGVRVKRRTVVVYLLPSGVARCHDDHGDRPVQVGLIVGRIVGGAVVRNAVRRRLRHVMGNHLEQLPAGCRVVVRALPGAAGQRSSALAGELEAAVGRALERAEKRR